MWSLMEAAPMRFVGRVWRPPSEGRSLLVQATIGCSWNQCAYCDMYTDKPKFSVRPLTETLQDLRNAGAWARDTPARVEKLFVTDGDAMALPMDAWEPILETARDEFPELQRVSCYATARNVADKSDAELRSLREKGLELVYMGPESGDDRTLHRLAKGGNYAAHVEAAQRVRAAGMKLSTIFLLGAGGVDRWREHAEGSARLATDMDPHYLSLLTLMLVPGTPLHRKHQRGKFALPDPPVLMDELRIIVAQARPSDALFRTNHANNYLSLGGRLPRDRDAMLERIDAARAGRVRLRPEGLRGL